MVRNYLIFSLFLSVLFSCSELSENEKVRISASLADSLINRTETWNLHQSIIEDGLRKVEIRAPYAYTIISDTTSYTKISGPVEIQIYDSLRTIEQQIWADELTYFSRKSLYLLKGNVIVEHRNKTKLRTQYLEWDQNERRVYTPEFVQYTSVSDSIAGYIFTANDDLSNYQLSDVTGTVVVED